MNDIIKTIENEVVHINKMMDWTKTFLKKDIQSKTRTKLVNQRRKLNKIKFALEVNPAASIYGESQVGKSYLVDNLLSDEKGSLKIFDGKGNEYDFINDCNPAGGGKESTGVVTRFTTRKIEGEDKDFVIETKLLTVKDVILLLVDSFFNDIKRQKFCTAEELVEKIEQLSEQYQNRPTIEGNNKALTEDDIYDIKDYFEGGKFFSRGYHEAENIAKSGFFESLGFLINKIPQHEWTNLFSLLWGKQDFITDVFEKLLGSLKKINFDKKVYIKIDPVLRKNGTILDVSRTRELFGENTIEDFYTPDLEVKTAKGIVKIPKSNFSTITSELVFHVKKNLEKSKQFLIKLDLLDFPGARSRLDKELEDAISLKSDLVLRGKVAYLFNYYTANFLINNLLFCHHDKQSEVKSLSNLLYNWVNIVIGETQEERELFIEDSKVSPLFIVGTKFNTDLTRTPADNDSDIEKVRQSYYSRWDKRFSTVLSDVLGLTNEKNNTKSEKWFTNWTTSLQNFSNTYLLRSYDFSDRSGIFKGFNKHLDDGSFKVNLDDEGNKVGEIEYGIGYESFLQELKKSFEENKFVSKHFKNPSKSWDEAATLNKDGSEWIIENLNIAAENTSKSRMNSFLRQLHVAQQKLNTIFTENYHSDDSDKNITTAKQKAGKISLQLAKFFTEDRFFFSQFISKMLISESEVHDLLLETVNDMSMIEDTDTSQYFAVREMANVDPNLEREENEKRILKAYSFADIEEAKEYFNSISINFEDLFKPKITRNFASIITDVVVNQWYDKYLVSERYEEFIERGFTQESLDDLLLNMKALFKTELKIGEQISNKLRKYVLNPTSLDMMIEMLADISSEMINRFVNEVGFSYYSESKWEGIKQSNQQNNLGLNMNISSIEDKTIYDTKSIEDVFKALDSIDEIYNDTSVDRPEIQHIPNYSSFKRWTSLMEVSFIAACDIPTYDRLANEELGKIIDSYSQTS